MSLIDLDLLGTYTAIDSVATGIIPSLFCAKNKPILNNSYLNADNAWLYIHFRLYRGRGRGYIQTHVTVKRGNRFLGYNLRPYMLSYYTLFDTIFLNLYKIF